MKKDKFNATAGGITAIDFAIDRYLETGNASLLTPFYKPKETEAERTAALLQLGSQRLDNPSDPRAWVKAWMGAGLQLPTAATGGKTPLDYAREAGNTEIAALLMRAGGDVSKKDTAAQPVPPLKL